MSFLCWLRYFSAILCFITTTYDSVHATIERYVRKKIVWAPSEWDTIFRNARINPKPFEVVRMQYSDFKNWKRVADECTPSNCKTADGQAFKISLVRQAIFQKGKSNFDINYTYDDISFLEVIMAKPKGMLHFIIQIV